MSGHGGVWRKGRRDARRRCGLGHRSSPAQPHMRRRRRAGTGPHRGYREALLREREREQRTPGPGPRCPRSLNSRGRPRGFVGTTVQRRQVYAPSDPEAQGGQQMVNSSFMAPPAPDSRKKLQKLKGLAGMNSHERSTGTGRSPREGSQKKRKKKVSLLGSALRGKDNAPAGRLPPPKGGKPRTPLA